MSECVSAGRVEVGRVLLKLARTLLEHTPLGDRPIGCFGGVEWKQDIKSQKGRKKNKEKKKTAVMAAGLTGFPCY